MKENYVAMAVVLLIWTGLYFYLLRLEKKVDKLKRDENTPGLELGPKEQL